MTGKAQLNSRLINTPSSAFGKANDRFRMTNFKNPAGANYTPKTGLNQNVKSDYKFRGSTKFSHSRRTFVDELWKPKDQALLPAPGAYKTFSDFSGF